MNELRILIVEDSDADAKLLSIALSETRGKGIPVRAARACSSREAQQMLASDPFDIVLVNLDLPDTRGAVTLRRILRICSEAAVIVLAENDAGVSARWITEGAQDVVAKNQLEPQTLLRTMQHSLARQRLMRDFRRNAFVDSATGLLTRRSFRQIAAAITRNSGETWSVGRIRMQGMLKTMETAQAASIILELAEGLRAALPEGAWIARVGEDGAEVLSPTGAMALHAALEALSERLNKSFTRQRESQRLGCIFGVSEMAPGQPVEAAAEKAAIAMCENDIAFAAGA